MKKIKIFYFLLYYRCIRLVTCDRQNYCLTKVTNHPYQPSFDGVLLINLTKKTNLSESQDIQIKEDNIRVTKTCNTLDNLYEICSVGHKLIL